MSVKKLAVIQEQTKGKCDQSTEISEMALDETGETDMGQGGRHLTGLLSHVVF